MSTAINGSWSGSAEENGWHVVAVPGPDACLKLLGGRAPSHSHEPPVLQGQPRPALDWLIACAYTGIVVGREIREGGWTPVH